MEKIKPTKGAEMELRLQKLENELKIAFSAIAELKAEIYREYSTLGKTAPFETESGKFKKVSENKAIEIIRKYISKNPGCLTSEIIFNLQIDPDLVLSVLKKLRKQGEIRSEPVGQKK